MDKHTERTRHKDYDTHTYRFKWEQKLRTALKAGEFNKNTRGKQEVA